jgi:uncharacterized protein (TIGR02300 family)
MANRGLKRICTSCGTKFYDFGKLPIVCPSCGTEYTGEIEVKARRAKSTIVADTVKRDEIEAKNKEVAEANTDDETISLDDLNEDGDDEDDDLSDISGDITISKDEDDK